MPKVSVNILTKNRAMLLKQALVSVHRQNFADYEIVIINDGSTDETQDVIQTFKHLNIKTIEHQTSFGITFSRQEALLVSKGEYIAILDDDDEWINPDKLKKQVEFLDQNQDCVLVGGGISIISNSKFLISKQISNPNAPPLIPLFDKGGSGGVFRPETDGQIRKTMLLRNNFFTSTIMFRREAALKAGGFIKDQDDFAEDYDLWLRMGRLGKMHNFQEAFTKYRLPDYTKEKLKAFFKKQLRLINRYKKDYQLYWLAFLILKLRINFSF
jgi:glycosyltransferase involved in cell wall biosynthesis